MVALRAIWKEGTEGYVARVVVAIPRSLDRIFAIRDAKRRPETKPVYCVRHGERLRRHSSQEPVIPTLFWQPYKLIYMCLTFKCAFAHPEPPDVLLIRSIIGSLVSRM